MQNKRTWLYLILMLILFTLICAQQQQINDLRDDLSALQEQTIQIEKQLNEHITPPLPAETADGGTAEFPARGPPANGSGTEDPGCGAKSPATGEAG